MYRYDQFDQTFVEQRVAQFRDQVLGACRGELTEEQFRPLRLMNGCTCSYTPICCAWPSRTARFRPVRCANSRTLPANTIKFGHFTTRQNIQYNWPALSDIPDILAELAEVEMHALQTSGNCIRNISADQHAGQPTRSRTRASGRKSSGSGRASGVFVPAAQVQGGGDRRSQRPGRPRGA